MVGRLTDGASQGASLGESQSAESQGRRPGRGRAPERATARPPLGEGVFHPSQDPESGAQEGGFPPLREGDFPPSPGGDFPPQPGRSREGGNPAPGRRGGKKCTFSRVFNNSPIRDRLLDYLRIKDFEFSTFSRIFPKSGQIWKSRFLQFFSPPAGGKSPSRALPGRPGGPSESPSQAPENPRKTPPGGGKSGLPGGGNRPLGDPLGGGDFPLWHPVPSHAHDPPCPRPSS